MPTVSLIISFAAGCLLTVIGIFLFLRVQPRLGLLDVPNERSSHTAPIPRGAGVVVAAVTISLYIAVSFFFGQTPDLVFVLTSLCIAAVSFVDDLRPIPFIPRLLVHVLAAVILVLHSGGFPGIVFPFVGSADFGLAAGVISVLFIVWMVNAYNFMDGIDGLLGVQAILVGVGWALVGSFSGWSTGGHFGSIVAGCSLGFLLFNWQPARVFMGDVGSTFLGFFAVGLPLVGNDGVVIDRRASLTLAVLFSLLFLFDTIYTRMALIARGENFWRPHREHHYQKLVRSGVSHRGVATYFAFAGALISAPGILGLFSAAIGFVPAAVIGMGACLVLGAWARNKH